MTRGETRTEVLMVLDVTTHADFLTFWKASSIRAAKPLLISYPAPIGANFAYLFWIDGVMIRFLASTKSSTFDTDFSDALVVTLSSPITVAA